MKCKQCFSYLLIGLLTIGLLGCGVEVIDESFGTQPQKLEINYNVHSGRLWVTVYPGLRAGETLHVRVRNGTPGYLDCASMAWSIERIDTSPQGSAKGGAVFQGPPVNQSDFISPYNNAWLEGTPTPEMIAAAQAKAFTIDICIMQGSLVVRGAEMDIMRALDSSGTGKFDGYDESEQIASVVAYGQACVSQLGEIPFFPKTAEGDYRTYNCLDSVPIPTSVTGPSGAVEWPQEQVDKCDNPQYIYSLCERNAVNGVSNGPRVISAENEQGTHWVLLCRKAKSEEGEYNDIAMLGHNPYTGKTCYFQNALYSRTDGLHVPHPADEVNSPESPHQSSTLWSGIQGGIGSGIECVKCHDADPFIHTPWIDGAKDEKGDPVIPKLGIDDGFAEGYNEAPYTLINAAGQGWTMPKHLVSEEAAACTKCHRIGDGRWTRSWIDRLVGEDISWNKKVTEEHLKFEHMYWMPPELEGLDEATWADSEFGKALKFIQNCGNNLNDPGCIWAELPTEPLAEVGELPAIELEGPALAMEALKILGAEVTDPSDARCDPTTGSCSTRRCAECHSVSKSGLKHWRKLTTTANNTCGLKKDPDEMTQDEALAAVNCARSRPEEPDSVFAADKVGILTTGARYGYFRKLFRKAFGDGYWLPEYIRFKSRVSMPKGVYAALSQFEHAVLLKWFESNLSHLDDLIKDPPPPETCDNFTDAAEMGKHIENMKYDGWGAINKEENGGLLMYGCPIGGSASDCFLGGFQDRTVDWGAGQGALRQVTELSFRTSFWTRSSADGRFIANGGGNGGGATITDMQRGIDIKVKATYDPGFFPDNSGFIFQGGGTIVCSQKPLESATEVNVDMDWCMKGTNINLYQHVAKGLEGGDYFIINSQFTSDSGNSTSADPKAHFNAGSTMKFSPMFFNGTNYEQLSAVIVDSPYEGDSVLSPSGNLVISRLSGGENGGPLGYVIRRVTTEKFANNYKINVDQVLGRYCFSGAKANISFDERFFVTHHYADGKSNIFLVDLLNPSAQPIQVTNMPEGGKALFPHFRSDGWFYFLVRHDGKEYVVASDLAVQLAAGTP